MVGFDSSDDAAVYRASTMRRAMIATVDFFPPIVDDPFQFGQVAATNPPVPMWGPWAARRNRHESAHLPNCLPLEVQGILAGGYDKVMEAGAVIVGGPQH